MIFQENPIYYLYISFTRWYINLSFIRVNTKLQNKLKCLHFMITVISFFPQPNLQKTYLIKMKQSGYK